MSLRVLIAVTHLLGVGHLARSAALGRALVRAGHRVTLASGGRSAPLVDTAGLDFVQLPPVYCVDADFTRLLGPDGTEIDDGFREARIAALLAAFEAMWPDVVITETFPFGRRQLRREFRALLDAAWGAPERPAVLASIRDILNPPSRPEKAEEADALVRDFYDGVLVHGEAAAAPLSLSWPVSEALRHRLRYTGYLVGEAATEPAPPRPSGEVVVSGGGGAAGLPLFEAAIGAAALDRSGRRWRILVGHGVSEPAFAALASCGGEGVTVERARPDFRALLAAADLSVSQAGYNTALDLAAAGVRAVLVPFEAGSEQEQRLRAEGLAAAGRATLLRERELSPATLLAAAERELRRARPAAAPAPLEGAAAGVRAVEAAAAEVRRTRAAWDALARRLDGIAAAGRSVTLWWRDDDAAEPTAALDRLLAVAGRAGVPLALAVSPGLATDALAPRLAGEAGIGVLVHGLVHRNHAPPGAKKRELGHRPPETILAELAAGLAGQEARFGPQALPVLVPPWNRIDAALVPGLRGAGFSGLSTFGPRGAPRRDGLAVVNTHCDPVWWRGGGGLAAEADLLDGLRRNLDLGEPVGLLTHHLVHDERIWRFVERLVGLLAAHPAVRMPAIATLLGDAPSPVAGVPPPGEAA